jgi:hypothetical protein
MARLFPVGDYPPTDQELVILRILGSRPHHGWTLGELLDEVSKGRAKPMSYSALAVHMTHLRRKGFAIKREVVYSVGGIQPPGSDDSRAPGRHGRHEQQDRADRDARPLAVKRG